MQSETQKCFVDKMFQSNFALWNVLVSVNGIMLTAFSVLALLTPTAQSIPASLLVGSCSISIGLVVWNFLAYKRLYLEIGQRLSDPTAEIGEDQAAREIERSGKGHKWVQRRETAALWMLLLQVCLIIVLLYTTAG